MVVVVCDGCGWGNGARKAARDAAAGFHNYMLRHHQEITDIHYASHLVARAVAMAQQAYVYMARWSALCRWRYLSSFSPLSCARV